MTKKEHENSKWSKLFCPCRCALGDSMYGIIGAQWMDFISLSMVSISPSLKSSGKQNSQIHVFNIWIIPLVTEIINVIYHATESPRSIATRVHLELTVMKSRYGSLEVIMISSMTSAFYSAKRMRS